MDTQNALVPFAFGEHLVRSMLDETGNPWFVAKDVCRVLELENVTKALYSLDDDEKITLTNSKGNPRAGIPHQYVLISESGLYALVFRSRKPEAKAFSKWVRAEVLPTLRKTGTYTMPGAAQQPRNRAMPVIPEVARRLKPSVRQRLWSDAMRAASLDSEGTESAVAWFETLCNMMLLPSRSGMASEEVERGVRAFARSACVDKTGKRVVASRMYAAFCRWWKENLTSPIPSPSAFGNVMGGLVGKAKIGGRVFYLDVALLD